MPTNTVGLIIFVALLLPGLIHVLVAERSRQPTRQASPFREVAIIATSSVGTLAFACVLFAAVRSFFPQWTPNVGHLVRDRDTYLKAHYAQVMLWATTILLTACLTAYTLAAAGIVRRVANLLPPKREVGFESGWWTAFEQQPDSYKEVRCLLTSGVQVTGWLTSYSAAGDDTPDRDIILSAPFTVVAADGTNRNEQYGAVVLNARDIEVLEVQHDSIGPTTDVPVPEADDVRSDPATG